MELGLALDLFDFEAASEVCSAWPCNLVTLNRCSTEMDSWNFVGPINAMGMAVCA